MTGEEWLASVFEQALGRDELIYQLEYARVLAALSALRECGVLDEATAADAERRLSAARDEARGRTKPRVKPPGAPAQQPTNAVRAVLAPFAPLAEVDSGALMLLSVELWGRCVYLTAARVETAESDRQVEEHARRLEAWHEGLAARGSLGTAAVPPDQPAQRLSRVEPTLSDNLGTAYRLVSGQYGGSGTDWRLLWKFAPGVPQGAATLAVEVPGGEGRPIHRLELSLTAHHDPGVGR